MTKLFDRVKFNTSTTGTSDITIGSASSGAFYLPSEVGAADGDTVRYIIVDGTDVEEGVGTIADSVATLQRTTVSHSKVGGVAGTSKLTLSGTAVVALTAAGADILVPANNLADVADAAAARTNLGLGTAAVRADTDFPRTDAAQSLSSGAKAQARTNIASPLRGHLWGLTLSTAGSSSSFGIAAGECADETGADLLVLASAITKTTGAWAVGTGNGALDTGTIANAKWYHVHLIKRPDTGVVDVLISLSATAPTLPTNYTLSRRVGALLTDGSAHWTAFSQVGDEFLWKTAAVIANAVVVPTSSTSVTISAVPSGVQVMARLRLFQTVTAGGISDIIVQSPDETPSTPNAAGQGVDMGGSAGTRGSANLLVRTNSSAQINWASTTANGSVYMVAYGWFDRRGKDS